MATQQQVPRRDLPEVPYFTLDVHERPVDAVLEVLLTGDVDALTVGHLDDSLDWVVQHTSHPQVIVDVSAVRRLEPGGLETLARARAALQAEGRTLTLRGLT